MLLSPLPLPQQSFVNGFGDRDIVTSTTMAHVTGDPIMEGAVTGNAKMDTLLQEVRSAFTSRINVDSLLDLSQQLQCELREHLVSSPQCMLPSYTYKLPSGKERGTYLGVEVGGSNLRMALVDLHGRRVNGHKEYLTVRRSKVAIITREVREKAGLEFFDWMALNFKEMLEEEPELKQDEPLPMGIAWSFPIEQTSTRSGNVLGMGKGFLCSNLITGQDLGDIIMQACRRKDVNVRLDAIVNDTTSALLAHAYLDPTTRLAIVLGTGVNAAIHAPLAALHPSKFERRKETPPPSATHVLTNTEFSMFSKNILPTTRWDDALNRNHVMPDYQPFEYLIAGGYLGEIVRLILVDAAASSGFFGGTLPPSLQQPYSLETRTIAGIHKDQSPTLDKTITLLHTRHPPVVHATLADARFIQHTVHAVVQRSIAYFATGVHALTSLLADLNHDGQQSADTATASLLQPTPTAPRGRNLSVFDAEHISIGCDGSVINKYPGYMDHTQRTLDEIITREKYHLAQKTKCCIPSSSATTTGTTTAVAAATTTTNGVAVETQRRPKRIMLEKTEHSAVLGAGVAVSLAVLSSP